MQQDQQSMPPQGYFQQDYIGGRESFQILEYLQLLWFRRRIVIAVTVLGVIFGFIHVNQLVPVYTASSTMVINLPEAQVLDIEQVLTRDYYGRGTEVTAEVEILRSRDLAGKVIEKLQLMNYEEFNPLLHVPESPEESFFDFLKYLNPKTWILNRLKRSIKEATSGKIQPIRLNEEETARKAMVQATNIFLGKLSAEPIEWSNVIRIKFNSLSPVLAARIANEVPEAYILGQLQAKFDATTNATAWLTEQLSGLKMQVTESENAVEVYRAEHGMSKGARTGILSERLSKLNSQLITAKAERAEVEARYSQVKQLIDQGGQSIESASVVLASSLIQQLRNQEAQIAGNISELSIEYGPKHPRMLQARAEIVDIKQRIDIEINKITRGLKNDLDVVRMRVRSLENNLKVVEQRSSSQDREAVQLRALEREAEANRALYETFLNRFKETSATQGIQTSDARIISAAAVPSGPSYPNKSQSFSIIVTLSFLAACALVMALHFLNPGLYSPEQIESELGLHTIGLIPKLPGKIDPFVYLLERPNSSFAEALNSMKVSLKLSDPDAQIKALQTTSSVPGEGKTSLAMCLAIVMAKEGKKVLVVDADLRRSTIGKKLGLPEKSKGLTDYMLADTDLLDDFIFSHEESGIDFMLSGDAKYANATDILTSKRMQALVMNLKQLYDTILFDTPPVMAVADARVMGQITDKTLFVVRWDKTPRKVVKTAIDLLAKGGTYVHSVVLQQVDLKRYGRLGYGDSGYYYHYSRYGQYYQD